jgi:hypothetical protein
VTAPAMVRTFIVILALEWELGSQDPVVFCYRIGVKPARVFLARFAKPR